MRKGFVEKKVGRCLTEYRHPEYEEIVNTFGEYRTYSQFENYPKDGEVVKGYILLEPKCGTGQLLYGLNDKNEVTLLKAIIDSSD